MISSCMSICGHVDMWVHAYVQRIWIPEINLRCPCLFILLGWQASMTQGSTSNRISIRAPGESGFPAWEASTLPTESFFLFPQIPAQVQESGSEPLHTSFVTNWHKQMFVSYAVGGTFLLHSRHDIWIMFTSCFRVSKWSYYLRESFLYKSEILKYIFIN